MRKTYRSGVRLIRDAYRAQHTGAIVCRRPADFNLSGIIEERTTFVFEKGCMIRLYDSTIREYAA